jgi:hypothetical protein
MDQKITLVLFNQRQGRAEIGKQINDFVRDILPNHHLTQGGKVEKIFYHQPQGDGDQHYVVIELDDGMVRRIWDINDITWEPV